MYYAWPLFPVFVHEKSGYRTTAQSFQNENAQSIGQERKRLKTCKLMRKKITTTPVSEQAQAAQTAGEERSESMKTDGPDGEEESGKPDGGAKRLLSGRQKIEIQEKKSLPGHYGAQCC